LVGWHTSIHHEKDDGELTDRGSLIGGSRPFKSDSEKRVTVNNTGWKRVIIELIILCTRFQYGVGAEYSRVY
jgi:hypothetical protein